MKHTAKKPDGVTSVLPLSCYGKVRDFMVKNIRFIKKQKQT